MSKRITLKLNREQRTVEVEPSDILLDVLREKIGVKSPKIGCERGDCGACTVLLDGKSVRSCLILAIEADGHQITTVEGLSHAGLTPLQRSFLKHGAFQCGFCAPGIVLSATELLKRIRIRRKQRSRKPSRATSADAPATSQSSMQSSPSPRPRKKPEV